MKILSIEGRVFSGGREGARFVELPWVREQVAEKLGFVPYPGTLNLKLVESGVKLKKLLKKAKPIEISPAKGFCRGRCVKAHLTDNLECAIVIPEIENYAEDVLEVIAPINVRKKFQLKDGDIVAVKIML